MKWILTILMLAVGVLVAFALVKFGPEPEAEEASRLVPPVAFVVAQPEAYRLTVASEGTVVADTESNLIPEVSGRIIKVSPTFEAGFFFEQGELLLELDPIAYEVALAEAHARAAASRLALEQEKALRDEAAREWKELGRGQPSSLTLREPQLAKAEADLTAAQQSIRLAERNLERTQIRAPYAGRVRSTHADLGQQVTANSTVLGVLYAVDEVEIPVPLSMEEVRYLDNGVILSGGGKTPASVRVEVGREVFEWDGRLDRVEGAIDHRSRTMRAVVAVRDPYGHLNGSPHVVPLTVGMYATVELGGRVIEPAYKLPRSVMVRQDAVYVIDNDDRLHLRTVEVLQSTPDFVVITKGLQSGDRLNVTPIDFYIEGMKVAPRMTGMSSAVIAGEDEP